MPKTSTLIRLSFLSIIFLTFAFIFSAYTSSQSKSSLENKEPSALREAPEQIVVDNTPHNLVGAFYTLEDNTDAKLLLNNKGNIELEVQPTLYNLQGQELQLPSVMVEPQSFRFINLQDWASIGGQSFRSGSIKLFHVGKDLVLGAQIYLTDEARSLSFEEKLTEIGKFDSRKQETVWVMPTQQTQAQVALTNTTNSPLSLTAKLSKNPNTVGSPQTFQLAAHETKILDLRQDFTNGNQFANAAIVGLSLQHTAVKDALLARVMVEDAAKGYSNVVQFSNPDGGKSNEYQGVGFQIEDVNGLSLAPIVVAKNVGTTKATVTTRVPYTRIDGTRGTISLPKKQLAAGEMNLIDTRNVITRVQQEQIKIASLEVEYNTAPGSVIVAAHSVSTDGNQVFRVPMWDPLGQRSPTGGYPWRIEGTSVTETYIKNITDQEQNYVAFLLWENGGIYMIGLKPVAARETVHIDIKKLRDEQIPDERGRTIPLYVSSGQMQWTLRRKDNLPDDDVRANLALIGRSEQVDTTKGIVNNYSCQNCCTGDFVSGRIEPASPSQANQPLEVDSTRIYFAVEEQKTCYGFGYEFGSEPEVRWDAVWASSDLNTATVSGGHVTGRNPGNANISASWYPRTSIVYPCSGGGEPIPLTGEEENCDETEGVKRVSQKSKPTAEIAACGTCVSRRWQNPYTAYTYVSVIPKVSITINRDGSPISSTQEAVIGQKISLSATVTGGTPSSQQWTIPDTKVANYVVNFNGSNSVVSTGIKTDLTANDLNQPNVDFYWVDGGNTRQVQYSVIVGGRQYTKTATFNVQTPVVNLATVTSQTSILQENGLDYLYFATDSAEGIKFYNTTSPQIPPSFGGTTQWVQVVNSSYRKATFPNGTSQTLNDYGLDGCYPYTTRGRGQAFDSPNQRLSGSVSAEIDDSYTMWLMYQPNTPNAIWVPLKKVSWYWNATAQITAGQWTFSGNNSPNPGFGDTVDFPQWSQNVPTNGTCQ